MRSRRIGSVVAASMAGAWIAAAALAAVAPRDLKQQLRWAGDEVAVGEVVSIEERIAPEGDGEPAVFSWITFRVEESFAGFAPRNIQAVVRGSVLPGGEATSITPSPETLRVGRKLLLFLDVNEFVERTFGKGVFHLHSYAETYRIEKDVVLGQGAGAAFEESAKVADARAAVAQALAEVRAEKAERGER
jgi:hypothetical protein